MGVIFAQYNDFQISFTKAGNVELIKPNLSPTGTAKSTTYKLKYTITGNTIEVYDKDDFMLMTLNGKQILCTIDGIELILQKN